MNVGAKGGEPFAPTFIIFTKIIIESYLKENNKLNKK